MRAEGQAAPGRKDRDGARPGTGPGGGPGTAGSRVGTANLGSWHQVGDAGGGYISTRHPPPPPGPPQPHKTPGPSSCCASVSPCASIPPSHRTVALPLNLAPHPCTPPKSRCRAKVGVLLPYKDHGLYNPTAAPHPPPAPPGPPSASGGFQRSSSSHSLLFARETESRRSCREPPEGREPPDPRGPHPHRPPRRPQRGGVPGEREPTPTCPLLRALPLRGG